MVYIDADFIVPSMTFVWLQKSSTWKPEANQSFSRWMKMMLSKHFFMCKDLGIVIIQLKVKCVKQWGGYYCRFGTLNIFITTWYPKQPFSMNRNGDFQPFFHGKDLVHHPTETTSYKWMRVSGSSQLYRDYNKQL